jgi:hypothetical protein
LAPIRPSDILERAMQNKREVRFITFLLLPATLAAGACTGPGLDDATRERVMALGDPAAMALVGTLGGRLNARLAAGGPSGAIDFCATEARTLTDSVSATLGPGWEVKRTTARTRNPRNAPDALEAEALQLFQGLADDGEELPRGHVQQTPDGGYRYYMPLRIGPMCLECHGPRESLEPEVRGVLDQRYPADQATAYSDGDFRGLIRVTVPREAVR